MPNKLALFDGYVLPSPLIDRLRNVHLAGCLLP
jgi:hypothetical protein